MASEIELMTTGFIETRETEVTVTGAEFWFPADVFRVQSLRFRYRRTTAHPEWRFDDLALHGHYRDGSPHKQHIRTLSNVPDYLLDPVAQYQPEE